MTRAIGELSYLAKPDLAGRRPVGVVRRRGDQYEVRAEPDVLQMVKRVFPGCRVLREPLDAEWRARARMGPHEDGGRGTAGGGEGRGIEEQPQDEKRGARGAREGGGIEHGIKRGDREAGARANWGGVMFAASPRIFGDLNWVLQRYPMEVEAEEAFEADRRRAIDHARRREGCVDLKPVMAPAGFRGELKPFQAEAVAYLLTNRRTLLADEMGLGKTVMALASLGEARGFPALVVCTSNLMRQWEAQAENFLEIRNEGEFIEGPALCHRIRGLTPYELPPASITIIHYGLLRGWKEALRELAAKVVIFDEIQELRNTGTQKYSVATYVADVAEFVWGLSGTPIYNLGGEMWSVVNALEMNCLGDYGSFSREWCTGFGTSTIQKPAELGAYLRREGLMLRRRTQDVQSQIPKIRPLPVYIDHDADVYAKLIERAVQLSRRYASITDFHEKGLAKREIDTASRQATGIAKASHVGAFVRSLMEAGERPLVFAHHHAVHDLIAKELPRDRWARISGRETQREKDKAIRDFDGGIVDGVLLSLRTAAGLDGLQRKATCIVFGELDWSPAIHAQCAMRLARMGVNPDLVSIRCYYLLSATGFDQVMQSALGLKVGQFVGLMGDTPDTQEDRLLAESDVKRHLDEVIERLRAGE